MSGASFLCEPLRALLAVRLDTSEVGVVDLATGETVNTLDSVDPADTPFTASVALHPEGEVIAAIARDGGVDLVDPDTFEVTGPLF